MLVAGSQMVLSYRSSWTQVWVLLSHRAARSSCYQHYGEGACLLAFKGSSAAGHTQSNPCVAWTREYRGQDFKMSPERTDQLIRKEYHTD